MSKEQWLLLNIQTRLEAVKDARDMERAGYNFVRETLTKSMAAQLIAEAEYALKAAAGD